MKIQIVSDLHLEFGGIEVRNKGADVLILSGDICVAQSFLSMEYDRYPANAIATRYVDFFNQVCGDFRDVVYILGNHEHYHGNFARTTEILRERFGHHSNLHILDIDHVDIDDVRFVGGTLWTDFNHGDALAMWDASRMMNDYRGVRNGAGDDAYRFMPEDAIMYHKTMLNYIEFQCTQHNKIVVVGHHTPSYQSIDGRYVGDKLNAAYASDLVDFIIDKNQIKLWTHGHVHVSQDYMIGTTRIVCNPRGYYQYEENDTFDSGKIVEV